LTAPPASPPSHDSPDRSSHAFQKQGLRGLQPRGLRQRHRQTTLKGSPLTAQACPFHINEDTSGIWDEILVDRTGRFASFSSINERDLPAAIAKRTWH
jgi:hypothetical protein